MPLSNEFTNTRLSYLKDAIKNTKIVSQQFYPRFVREYNEQFPFTEQKLSNVENPTNNSAVKGYLNKKTLSEIKADLTTKLISFTNDEGLARIIVSALANKISIGQLNYYNDNFNTIQKKISMPYGGISKEMFYDKILMALANDPHKSDVSIYNNSIPADKYKPPLDEDDDEDEEEDMLSNLEDEPMNDEIFLPETLRHTVALPKRHHINIIQKKGDELPYKNKFIKGVEEELLSTTKVLDGSDRNRTALKEFKKLKKKTELNRSNSNLALYDEELPSTSELKNFRGRKVGIPNIANRIYVQDTEDPEYIAFLERLLKRNVGIDAKEHPEGFQTFKRNYEHTPYTGLDSVPFSNLTTDNLNNMITNQTFTLDRVATSKESYLSPVKGPPYTPSTFNSPSPTRKAPPPPVLRANKDGTFSYTASEPRIVRLRNPSKENDNATITTAETQSTRVPVFNMYSELMDEEINKSKRRPRKPIKQIAKGIALPPLKFQDRVIKHKKVFNNKYAIDTKKLSKNILDLKYLKNANHVASFQPIEISTYLKNIIENIVKDNYNLKKEDFIHLNDTEKRILKRLFNFLKIEHDDVIEYSNDLQNQFEVAYGSFLAGNNNKELIKELKDYVKLALHENTIKKKDGQNILKKLDM